MDGKNNKDLPRRLRHKFGDRWDGYRMRTVSPMLQVMPFIMPQRCDALNYFTESLDITEAEKYVRNKVKEGKTNFTILHVFLASYIRAISQRPGINRFISGQHIFGRRNIVINMVVKKEMSMHSPDTCIKVYFEPSDTIDEVYEKFNAAVQTALADVDNKSDFDKVSKALTYIPRFLLRFTIKLLSFLDYFGIMPKALLKVSPFHGSMIITSMGSLGIPAIYHHLYNFGNLPVFISYGAKYSQVDVDTEGTPTKKRMIDMKVVTDERICDGYYYASAFKIIKRNVENPQGLELPPETIAEDIN